MNIKKKGFLFIFLIFCGVFTYGQDEAFQRMANARLYCQLLEQMSPNTGSLAWGLIRYLNPSCDEKKETVTENGLTRIGLCQIPKDIVEMMSKNKNPEYAYTVQGSITLVGAFYQIIQMQFPREKNYAAYMTVWVLLHGIAALDNMPDIQKVLNDRNVRYVIDFAASLQTGGL